MVGHPAFSYLCSCLWKPCTDNFHFHPVTKKNFITACRLQMRSCCRCEGRSHSVSEWHICKWVSLAWMCVVNFFFMEHYFLAQLLENMDRIFDIRGIIVSSSLDILSSETFVKIFKILTFIDLWGALKGILRVPTGPSGVRGHLIFFSFCQNFPFLTPWGRGGGGGVRQILI